MGRGTTTQLCCVIISRGFCSSDYKMHLHDKRNQRTKMAKISEGELARVHLTDALINRPTTCYSPCANWIIFVSVLYVSDCVLPLTTCVHIVTLREFKHLHYFVSLEWQVSTWSCSAQEILSWFLDLSDILLVTTLHSQYQHIRYYNQ